MATTGPAGVRLLRNESANGRPQFRLVTDAIMTGGYGGRQPLYVSGADTPAILDYDDDGDIDVLRLMARAIRFPTSKT